MISDIFLRAARRMVFAGATAFVVGIAAVPSFVTPTIASDGPPSVADLAERLLGAVVNISTSQTVKGTEGPGAVPMPQLPEGSPFQDFFDDFFKNRGGDKGGAAQKVQSLGSGFVIDAEQGIVVTNNHVIADADDIEVNFSDGVTLKAKLIGTDTKTDVAVLKVEPKGHKLTAVKFGDSTKMRVGDWVMAIGNPFGLGGTVTVGIVSARNRDINSGPYDDFIQTDAAINRGNSGGPLFNAQGEVIGINTAIISPSGGSIGIGFSIPSQLAAGVVDQLRQYGETRRGWLGVRIQPVTDDIAESLGMATAKGALVAGVIKGGPVDNGSVQAGDVIVKFDGKDIHEMRDLPRVVAESPVGKAVDVVIVRKGVEQTVKVTLGRLEDGEKLASGENGNTDQDKGDKATPPVSTASVLGMTVGELNDQTRQKFGIAADVSGVVITDVAKNSAAAERGIQPGEVITEIAQESVGTPKDVMDRIGALKEQGRKNALLMLASKTGELRFVTIRMD
ncbi:DegQ family serine endoprotease [Mesorhizobium sp. M2D.F.Ca.ET.185.01.1.1]|uniref:DegQ family serine endoprotease n=1 Tax=unclassified Mesorhizobium TaxID=325217 RepID=UPI000FCBABF2|nr:MULTISPECIES: DegQ family serine endoprotease [unclassified Mesorhizobium]TGP80355.1 DegQ family serine endoprotease [bacterium M00.F.Ca.ET.227.01.1.1]TGQ00676.1 DegQ family serine endoprotease [bacterium M00.F.Ca.ET.221.01.1.1]TGQ02803.1 DegQ family serine endoprotease [bacterium M00.F.Ca.ET.222.01.1.1]TGU01573.1 DegQ family serine endoprotease [bacterium M00.F.Ca.ET.163.01.1.1]TGU32428.1 DegQ family serine endoprotease [bacterium M00.F.Ca.ET.156.01.1.1]TGU44744.1 DegQ family serine endop